MPEQNLSQKYGFYGYLSEVFPSQINVDVTNKCNLSCVHCPHSHPDYHNTHCLSYLDESLNRKMVDEVSVSGKGYVQYIRYTADGEPLLHPKIYDMLAYAKEHSGSIVTLTTNGTLLNDINLEKLIKTNIDVIDISIDAYSDKVYSQIRKGGNHANVVNNVLNLLRRRNEFLDGVKIMVSFVEQELNQSEKELFVDYWTNAGVDKVIIRPLHSVGGNMTHIAEKMTHESSTICRYPCIYPWERILLMSDGFLHYCPVSWDEKDRVSDFRTISISDAWHGVFYQKLRQAHLDNSFEEFEFCSSCPDWKNICWPGCSRDNYASIVQKLRNKDTFSK